MRFKVEDIKEIDWDSEWFPTYIELVDGYELTLDEIDDWFSSYQLDELRFQAMIDSGMPKHQIEEYL